MRCWRSFVAIGDSFTEGLDDPYPDGDSHRGWADLVAEVLAGRVDDFRYANLALRGRLFDRVVAEQVPVARAMRPELASFAAGGNDVLRRRFDPEALAGRLDEVVETLRAAGAEVVLFQFADLTRHLPGQRLLADRAQTLNRAVAETAERHDAVLVDLWSDTQFHHPALWSLDRLHLSPLGHARVAAHVLTALGGEPPESWWRRPAPVPERGWAATRSADAAWLARHLLPWVGRRLTGRSSGDGRTPKRPTLASLTPVAPVPAPRDSGDAQAPERDGAGGPGGTPGTPGGPGSRGSAGGSGSEDEPGQRPVG